MSKKNIDQRQDRDILREEREINRIKADFHLLMNMTFITVVFAVFVLLVTLNPSVLETDYFLTLQLVLSIPFLMTSSLARAKLGMIGSAKLIDALGLYCFVIAYSFLINVIGILLSRYTPLDMSLIFFGVNVMLTLIYSFTIVHHDSTKLTRRIWKDSFFFIMILLFGIFHVLGFY